jgi:hypothetical protein
MDDEHGNLAAVRGMTEAEAERLRAINRRWWGSTILAVGIALGVPVAVVWVFLLWLWSLVKGSPTIS